MSTELKREAMLDEALAGALFQQPSFASWFLSRTKFEGVNASCVFCRSDNPWSRVKLEAPDALTGEMKTLTKECETDVLAVYAVDDGRRLAVHIENKLAVGSFTPHQPELYRERKEQWKGKPKLGMYTDATTVLVAPLIFYNRNREKAAIFESYISHEDISKYLAAFKIPLQASGVSL